MQKGPVLYRRWILLKKRWYLREKQPLPTARLRMTGRFTEFDVTPGHEIDFVLLRSEKQDNENGGSCRYADLYQALHSELYWLSAGGASRQRGDSGCDFILLVFMTSFASCLNYICPHWGKWEKFTFYIENSVFIQWVDPPWNLQINNRLQRAWPDASRTVWSYVIFL